MAASVGMGVFAPISQQITNFGAARMKAAKLTIKARFLSRARSFFASFVNHICC